MGGAFDGAVPDDWELAALTSVAEVTSGKRLPKGTSLVSWVTPHPYIRVSDMRVGGIRRDTELQYVPADVFPAISSYRIFEDELFISVAGTLGIVGKVPVELNGANLTENANRISSISCIPDYLMCVLQSSSIQAEVESIRTVGAQPKLALGRIREFEIPLPPLAEQRAIAEALSDADALIEALEALIEKKRLIKEGAVQELLTGKRRLPGYDGEWERVTLGEVGQIRGGDAFPKRFQRTVQGEFPFVKVSDLGLSHNGRFIRRTRNYISQETRTLIGAHTFEQGSIVFAKIGAALHLERKVVLSQESCIDNNMAALSVSRADTSEVFVAFALRFERLGKHAGVTAVPAVSLSVLRNIEIPIPPLAEQRAIAEVLTDMDDEIEALRERLEKTRRVKEGMMHELLTGRIRLL